MNSVNPGVIVTNIHRRAGMDDEAYAAFLEHSKTTHAMARVGDVTEVANAVGKLGNFHQSQWKLSIITEFLADNEKSSFTTGCCLPVGKKCKTSPYSH